jgi:hypothetical protein
MKKYGMFTICYDTSKWKPAQYKKLQIWTQFCTDHEPGAVTQLQTSDISDDKEKMKDGARGWRLNYAYDRKFSRCHRFKTFCVIHECDDDGLWKPTTREIEEAKLFHEFLELHKE